MDRWLASRLQGQLGAEPESAPAGGLRPSSNPSSDERPRPATRPPAKAAPVAARPLAEPRHRTSKTRGTAPVARADQDDLDLDEGVDDPATVLAHAAARPLRRARMAAAEEDAEDARTVRVSRMPVSFIGESVTDPTTAYDTSEAAARWREEGAIDEIDPLSDPHSLDPDPPKRTPEPAHAVVAPAELAAVTVDAPQVSTIVVSLLLGAVLGVGAVVITALVMF